MKQIIVICDDNSVNESVTGLFSDQYGTVSAFTFIDAIKQMDKRKPALIILDINMNCGAIDADGIGIVRLIKDKDEFRDIPMLVLADNLSRDDEALCLSLGVDDFISRDFLPQTLVKRATRLIEHDTYRRNERKAVRRSESSAATDSLTGLWNKAYIEKVISKYFSKEDRSGAFIIADIKNFKRINEELGYLAGDEVLKTLSKSLRAIFPDDVVSRIGGDEFVVFIREWTSIEAISKKVDALIRRMDEFFIKAAHGIASLAVGISKAPQNGKSFDELYGCAGKALYLVKKQKLNPFGFYEDDKSFALGFDSPSLSLQTNIVNLLEQLRENGEANGAYWQEYKPFIEIYRFIAREISRTRKSVFVLLLTVLDGNDSVPSDDVLSVIMERLHKVIYKALRKGDVFTRYSSSQYILLLLDTNLDSASAIAERIIETYKEIYSSPHVNIKYQLEKLQAKQS